MCVAIVAIVCVKFYILFWLVFDLFRFSCVYLFIFSAAHAHESKQIKYSNTENAIAQSTFRLCAQLGTNCKRRRILFFKGQICH